jgi:hypothetical protein
MSSIIRDGDTFHGISVVGRGVFTNDGTGWTLTYAGQHRDGYACGLGVATGSNGKVYAEHGPDGKCDGRWLLRYANGNTWYRLYERGKRKDVGDVLADGDCLYNGEDCAPDDPRLLALIAQVAPVEVRPAARAPTRHSPATRPKAIVRWIGGLVLPPQALATAVATEVHPHATRRGWWTWTQPNNSRSAPRDLPPRRACLPGFAVLESRSVLVGRGSRGQPASALGGARALRPTKFGGGLLGY